MLDQIIYIITIFSAFDKFYCTFFLYFSDFSAVPTLFHKIFPCSRKTPERTLGRKKRKRRSTRRFLCKTGF